MKRWERFDGKNVPRPGQRKALEWVSANLEKADILALNETTGAGKSGTARAIQRELGGVIITMSNVLLDQYTTAYPELPALKGKFAYKCEGVTCGDTLELTRKACAGCPYVEGRRQVQRGLPAISNPAAFYYASLSDKFQQPDTIIIDEADKLYEFVNTLGDGEMKLPPGVDLDTNNIVAATELIDRQVEILAMQAEAARDVKDRIKLARQMEKLRKTSLFLKIDPQSFYLSVDKKAGPRGYVSTLKVRSVTPSRAILKTFMSAKKVILLSATIFKKDVEKIADGRGWLLYQGEAAIPPENRPIYIDKISGSVGASTPPSEIANWIKKWRKRYPDRNTIVHVTYEWAARLRPFFIGEAILNDKDDKPLKIAQFKKKGGLFIAAGCAEGVDFPYDEARLNLIPILYRANINDEGVKRRLKLPGGQEEYDLNTIRTTIQQAGRSTRAPDDESIIIVGDPDFIWKMEKYKSQLPKGIYESIQWRRKL